MPRGVGVRVPLSAQARHFFECRVFAYKGTRTRCGGSADSSAVVDCASCCATTNIGRVLATQASLELTLTPYSIPSVSPPNQTTLVCSRSSERSSSPVVLIGKWLIYFEGRFSAYKGTREALLRNSCHIYTPSKPPFEKGGLWQVFHLLTLR